MSKLVIHSIIMLLIDGIMVKINYSAFCWGPRETSLRTPLCNNCTNYGARARM